MIDDPKIKQGDQDPSTTDDSTNQGSTGSAGGSATYGDVETEDEDMDINLEEEEALEDTDLGETEIEEN